LVIESSAQAGDDEPYVKGAKRELRAPGSFSEPRKRKGAFVACNEGA
jgi:hypothetical protein